MDTTTFDGIARTLSGSMTRRSALRGLVAGAVAAVAGGALLEAEDASAKRRRKKKNKRSQNSNPTQSGGQQPLLSPGSRCETSSQCTSHYICEVPVNGSNSDTYCSGAQGAICGAPNDDGDDTAPYCAVGYDCVFSSGSWTCQAVPDEI